ncbi:MAG: M50 family metallopeptidase [Actinomycetaceae bacterium]|nr:M50 family metallopeptidase [Actinomycetaceae bacterium]
MSYLIGILATVVALIISVALHELGHMIPAKKFGVYVPQYMVGFGPTLFSKQVGETEYGVKAILLGGYVRLAGMFAPARPGTKLTNRKGQPTLAQEAREASAQELEGGHEAQAFYRLSVPKKLTVMLGGPVTNLLLSLLIFAVIVLGFGFNTPTTTLESVPKCIGSTEETCSTENPASPAYEAGLRAGDRVVAWNGEQTESWQDVVSAIETSEGASQVLVDREGTTHEFELTPITVGERKIAGIVSRVERERGSLADWGSISWQAFAGTAGVVMALPSAVWDVTVQLFTEEPRDPNSVLSVVGVGRIAGEVSAETDVSLLDRVLMLLSLWGSLNMALFVFNLIPLPPLDGGHVAGAIWEGLRRSFNRLVGRPDPGAADTARLVPLSYTVFALLMVMTVILIAADIVKPISLI